MEWTTTRPDRPGWYAWRLDATAEPGMVEVYDCVLVIDGTRHPPILCGTFYRTDDELRGERQWCDFASGQHVPPGDWLYLMPHREPVFERHVSTPKSPPPWWGFGQTNERRK